MRVDVAAPHSFEKNGSLGLDHPEGTYTYLGSGVPCLNTFLILVPLRNHYEIKVYTFFSLVTSKSSYCYPEPPRKPRSRTRNPASLNSKPTTFYGFDIFESYSPINWYWALRRNLPERTHIENKPPSALHRGLGLRVYGFRDVPVEGSSVSSDDPSPLCLSPCPKHSHGTEDCCHQSLTGLGGCRV